MNELKLRLSKPIFDKYVLNPIFYVSYNVFSKKANVIVMKIGTHYLHHKRKRLCMSKKKNDVIIFSDVVNFLHIAPDK